MNVQSNRRKSIAVSGSGVQREKQLCSPRRIYMGILASLLPGRLSIVITFYRLQPAIYILKNTCEMEDCEDVNEFGLDRSALIRSWCIFE